MKIGIIGAGKISEKHILAYQALGYKEIAIHDVIPASAEKAAARFSIKAHQKLEELIGACDVIDVCTPVDTHKDLIIGALGNGHGGGNR